MRKKLALLMASLFLIVGTAWAQTIITDVSQLSNDKVYSIVPREGARGALYATSTSTHLDACGGTLDKAANPTVAINQNSADQQFALYKYDEQFYMYSVGAGKFLSTMNDRYFPLLNAPSQPVNITKSDTDGYFIIQIADNNINVSTGWSYGCVGKWNTADDGNRLQITEVSDMPENTKNQIISVLSPPFRPIDGKMYALKEVSTGLYLDIQTLGIHEPGHTTNSLSLNAHPTIIYFEASGSKWKIKNINGTYASNVPSGRDWNTTISDTPYDWIITSDLNGLTIAKDATNYIGWDKSKSITSGSALYNNAEGGNKNAARIYFTLVEYTSADLNPQGYYTLKLKDENSSLYLNFTESGDSKATLQETPTKFYLLPSASKNYLIFQNKDNASQFLGHPAGQWATTYDCKLWKISDGDENGLVLISRHADTGGDGGSDFGTNQSVEVGRKLYTNVKDNCKRWLIEGVIDCPTEGIIKNGNYEFTSAPIYYLNACNKLRFTLTESGGKFSNGTNRMSLDEFKLYNAKGEAVELQVSYITGNNNKTFDGMLDGVNDKFGGTATWNDGKENDWFEITLPNEIDLGGAFSFSYVTENKDMNVKAFRIDLSYEKVENDYTFTINVPSDKEASVNYDGTPVDGILTVSGYINPELIVATEIPGYTWSAEVDNVNYTVVISYTEAPATINPEAVIALANRIGGAGTSDKFKFVLDPSINSKQETFVLG
ncbi:MAG: hypothetical protein U0L77_09575, partial [Prevotellamassilia sp.]|nr:hypothetical protein [Prevotellamassilia sp.]